MATKSSHAHSTSHTGSKGGRKINEVMKEHKQGTLKSGSGKKVKSRKQAVAIALSEARKSGAKVPRKKRHKGSAPKAVIRARFAALASRPRA